MIHLDLEIYCALGLGPSTRQMGEPLEKRCFRQVHSAGGTLANLAKSRLCGSLDVLLHACALESTFMKRQIALLLLVAALSFTPELSFGQVPSVNPPAALEGTSPPTPD